MTAALRAGGNRDGSAAVARDGARVYVTLRGTPKSSAGSPGGAPRPRTSRLPGTVLALGVVSFFTDVSSESVVAVLPLYVTAVLGLSPVAYGFLDGVYQGTSALVRLLGGWWADRTGHAKRVAFVGYGVSALSRFALLGAGGFAAITGTVALDRLGKGLRTGPRDALIADSSAPEQLGRNFGVHRAMDTAGALVGPLAAFALVAAIPVGLGGYRSVFVLSAATAVIGLVVLLVAVPGGRRRAAEAARRASGAALADPPPRMRWRDLTQPGLRRLLLAAGLLGLLTVGDGFLYLVLAGSGTIGTTYFPLLMVGTNAAYLVLAVPLGRLADRVGRTPVFIGGYVLLLGGYLLCALQRSGVVPVVCVLLLLGAYYAATDGVLSAMATGRVPEASRTSGIAAAQTVVALSRFVSSIGFGLLWGSTGRGPAMLVMALGLATALPVAARLLRTPPATSPEVV